MAVSVYKTYASGEVLTASDLNLSLEQYAGSNGQSVSFPRTEAADFGGNELILDADGDTSITADTDDRIDFRLRGVDLFLWDGTTTNPVNGLTFVAAASGSDVDIQGTGSDADISILLTPKGSGAIKLGGMLDVNGQSIGDGTRALIAFVEDGSAVNHVEVENEATGSGPIIRGAGSDTDVPLNLQGKGSGAVQIGDAQLQFPDADGNAGQYLQTDGSAGLSWATPVPSGAIVAYGGAAAPTGWLLCDGSAVSRTTYADLFSAIGETYGAGDGMTTFNVPDMRGRVSVGAGTGAGLTARTLGDTGGAETHDHGGNTGTHAGFRTNSSSGGSFWENQVENHDHSISSDSSMQPFVVNTAIIKT